MLIQSFIYGFCKLLKKERGQYSAILTEQAWSIKDLLCGFGENFSRGIQRVVPCGQDSSMLPARIANHSARFGSSRKNMNVSQCLIKLLYTDSSRPIPTLHRSQHENYENTFWILGTEWTHQKNAENYVLDSVVCLQDALVFVSTLSIKIAEGKLFVRHSGPWLITGKPRHLLQSFFSYLLFIVNINILNTLAEKLNHEHCLSFQFFHGP